MLETGGMALVAWLLLAAASFRYRRQLGIESRVAVRGLRLGATLILGFALFRCGTAIDGERCVRFLGGASLAGGIVVMLLSVAPVWTMRPVALLLRMPTYFASRPSVIAAGSNAKSCAGSGAS